MEGEHAAWPGAVPTPAQQAGHRLTVETGGGPGLHHQGLCGLGTLGLQGAPGVHRQLWEEAGRGSTECGDSHCSGSSMPVRGRQSWVLIPGCCMLVPCETPQATQPRFLHVERRQAPTQASQAVLRAGKAATGGHEVPLTWPSPGWPVSSRVAV